jgi:ribonuclease P protein component
VTADGGPVRRLRKRSEFLRAARGVRAGRPAFSLQVIDRDAPSAGVGFTVTKRTGNSPERNRIRRRLREAARACAADLRPQHDYVLIGRRDALTTPFSALVGELSKAILRIHAKAADRPRNNS